MSHSCLFIELAGLRRRQSGRSGNATCLVRQVGGGGLQSIAGKSLLPRLVGDGLGHLLADFGGALDLLAGDFTGLVLDEIAGLAEILRFLVGHREGGSQMRKSQRISGRDARVANVAIWQAPRAMSGY